MAIILKKRSSPPPVVNELVFPQAMGLYDSRCAYAVTQVSANMAIPYFLMASYAYYFEDQPILTDGFYDELSKWLVSKWDGLQHQHKPLISPDDLKAGSLYSLKKEDYPAVVLGALKSLREMYRLDR